MKEKMNFPRCMYACIETGPEAEEGFFQYEVALFDREGRQIGKEWYEGNHINEQYCLENGRRKAQKMALIMLTRDEIMQLLDVEARTGCKDNLAAFIANWYRAVFIYPLSAIHTPKQAADTIYNHITKTYFPDADPHMLISRVKGSPWDNYPDHPQEDWRQEVACGSTVLGYWEWVEHRLVEDADERNCE